MEVDIIQLLAMTIEKGGSDLHLCANSQPMIRVHGILAPLIEETLDGDVCRELIYSIFTESQRSRFEETLELDFALIIDNVGRFRANAHYSRGMVEATFRHIRDEIPSIDKLGLPPIVKQLCHLERGLVIVRHHRIWKNHHVGGDGRGN